ncbi:MAG: hypothetical protein OEM24_08555, partial [Paracoccaceae bacterium]|nr:hypothetical protein [Paracoccaceae bacterium]
MSADLTRWNRAGLTRFTYTDANAAVLLEHLRAKMIALYLRGLPPDHELRQADYWFDLLRDADHPGPSPALAEQARDGLDWGALIEGIADKPETKAARNLRLIDNYLAKSNDYAAELMRGFARAGHVLSGYLDAYMNESYLSTATQWSSLEMLGAMVNYAPIPAASAESRVALTLAGGAGAQLIPAGLAMSAQPPGGGAPLLFETLAEITAHPDLNAARERRWNVNRTVLDLSGFNDWALDGQDPPQPGSAVVLAPAKMTEPSAKAVRVQALRNPAEGVASLRLDPGITGTWRAGYAELWYAPAGSATGLPRTGEGLTVVAVEGAGLSAGTLVEVDNNTGFPALVEVVWADGLKAGLRSGNDISQVLGVRPLVPYLIKDEGYIDTPPLPQQAYFLVGTQVQAVSVRTTNVIQPDEIETGVYKVDGEIQFCRFVAPGGASLAGIMDTEADFRPAAIIGDPPAVTDALNNPVNTVGFSGKPPKGLAEGALYAARDAQDRLTALRVLGVRLEKDAHFIAFNKPVRDEDGDPIPPHRVTYFGPMTRKLHPLEHDRSQAPLLEPDGGVVLAGLSAEARALLRPGRSVIFEDETQPSLPPAQATLSALITDPVLLPGFGAGERDQAKIVFTGLSSPLDGFRAGYTAIRLNCLRAGHGETRPAKILGSGNAEKARQSFPLDVKGISHVADPRAAAGVRPDIELRVDGVAWAYADLTDPAAEDTPSFSVRTREDGTLEIVLRRRLPTGQNNVRLAWHRVGSGRAGNGLPPGSFTKPKAKHRFVAAIRQPFATAGGSDREDPESIRSNSGSGIAANHRAVSLED